MAVDLDHLTQIREYPERHCAGGSLHLLLEVMAYADDEARELGRSGHCQVELHADGSVSVTDDGRGTDTRLTQSGQVVRKPVMATKDLRFFDRPEPEVLPDGCARRGVSVVTALSDWLVHTNRRPEGAWEQCYRRGVPSGPLRTVPGSGGTGTTIHYLVAPGVFTDGALTPERVGAAARFPSLLLTVQV